MPQLEFVKRFQKKVGFKKAWKTLRFLDFEKKIKNNLFNFAVILQRNCHFLEKFYSYRVEA